jgi:hypothetical protein
MKNNILIISIIGFYFSIFPQTGISADSEYYYVSSKNGLWMRETPETTGIPIQLIPYNAKVNVIEKKNGDVKMSGVTGKWMKVEVNDKTGWVFGGFLLSETYSNIKSFFPKEIQGNFAKTSDSQDGNFSLSISDLKINYYPNVLESLEFNLDYLEKDGKNFNVKSSGYLSGGVCCDEKGNPKAWTEKINANFTIVIIDSNKIKLTNITGDKLRDLENIEFIKK